MRRNALLAPDPRPLAPDEEFVVWLWQREVAGAGWLEPRGGPAVRLVYPGARQRRRGPDFQGALLATREGHLLQGDVEVHLRASDWDAHGHQRDRAYNGALLHVVWAADRAGLARRADGSTVPLLELSACLSQPLPQLLAAYRRELSQPAAPPCWAASEAGGWLEAAGQVRFQAKAAACQGDVAALGAEQAIYRRLAAALGYSANQRPFLRLADAVPVPELRGWVAEAGAEDAAERLLDWAGLGRRRMPGGLDADDWVLGGVRPGNLPQRRILALCHLVAAYGDGLAPALAATVLEAWEARRPGRLGAALCVACPKTGRALRQAQGERSPEPEDDWRTRGADVVARSPRLRVSLSPPHAEAALVGLGRAREMVVNALLPWAWAWGEHGGWPALQRAAGDCYLTHPRCGENRVTREAARLLTLSPRVARTACQQQGLLHLYRQRLHDPTCWRQDDLGRWRWQPWVEAVALEAAVAVPLSVAG